MSTLESALKKLIIGYVLVPMITIVIPLFFSYIISAAPLSADENESHVTDQKNKGIVYIGVLAKRGAEQCLKKWGETATYLGHKIPEHSFIILPLAFDEIRDAVENRHIDFILANPSYYVNLEVTLGVKRIATLNNLHSNGTASNLFAGVLITRKDRDDIKTWKDINGKSFVAVDPRSLGGWHMVLRELKAEGIDPQKDFESLTFAGTHDAVVHAVENGSADVGTVRSDTLERMKQEGKIDVTSLKVLPFRFATMEKFPFLHSTRRYPEWPFAKADHTDEQLAKKVTIALLQMEEKSKAAQTARCKGWTIPQNYQPVHELLHDLHLPPYDQLSSMAVSELWRLYKGWVWGGILLVLMIAGILLFTLRLYVKLQESRQVERKRHRQELFLNTLIESIPIPIYYKDNKGIYKGMNRAYEDFIGISRKKFIGKDVFELHPEDLATIYQEKDDELIKRGGHQRYQTKISTGTGIREVILDKAAFSDETAETAGMIGAILDITENRRYENLLAARLRLSEFSINNPIRELLRKVLDETETLSESTVSFFHFVQADQKTLSLQMWSTNTLDKGCQTNMFENEHYSIEQAGVWCDCIRERRPIIHNDYNSLTHRKELPEYHVPITRQLVVPVFRDNRIVAVLGIGNKQHLYTDEDVRLVHEMANLAWDLIQKKQAEEAKKDSEERYRSIMEAMEDEIYICSENYTIEYANPAMIRRIGTDIIGKKCYSALYNTDHVCHGCINSLIQAGDSVSKETKDPITGKIYHVTNAPLYQNDGSVVKLTVFRDISDIRNMEDHLQQVQKMEAIGSLAGGIAHDFNNILTPMLGYAELLKQALTINSSEWDYTNQILFAGMRAKELIEQILSFSRQNVEEKTPVKLQPIVKEALKLLRASIPKSIDITHEIDSDCSAVMATATKIHQVIMNLATNSYHAMEKEGGILNISLKEVNISEYQDQLAEEQNGRYARISVKDTGIGIKPININKIFDPYFTTKDLGKGTGLGLSVVKGIIESFSGTITIQSSLNGGTEVNIFLPVCATDSSPHALIDSQREIPHGKERILCVDDEHVITKMMKSILSRLGYQIETENDSKTALKRLLSNQPSFDLLITDLFMPKMSGIELAEHLHDNNQTIPIILCTGCLDTADLDRIKKAEIETILKKPFTKMEIAQSIRKCLDSA